MKGIELSKKYFESFGKEVLETEFSSVLPLLAVGLAGSGSECLGFDDEISEDHDFEPGFCIFLPDENTVDRRTAFLLERAYAKFPKEFMGFKRSPLSPVGGNRHGVIRMEDFFLEKVGSRDGRLTVGQWFTVPEQGLLEATNGAVFFDNSGQFSAVRERLSYFPEDIRLKKLAGNLLLMGQAGQYNYKRCILRGDTAAAQLAAIEFAKSALHSIYLLNKAYIPYYKWSFKGLKGLSALGDLSGDLEYLISSGNSSDEAEKKTAIIEEICEKIADVLKTQGLTEADGSEMERQAYAVNERITDHGVRTMHILSGV
ncbi:MAG: DUF4037 domain-containing protein [Clostridia bacterium]|nr:DUF4037 domain-containing protein [Clostridia bacterium]